MNGTVYSAYFHDLLMQPIYVSFACGDESKIYALIYILGIFSYIITIGKCRDRPVSIQMATKEIDEVFVRNIDWADSQRFIWSQSDAHEPII